MRKHNPNLLRFMVALFLGMFVRILPFRPPNIEPILAIEMPFARLNGAKIGFLFGFLSIIFYDLVTSTLGVWTLVTSITYGLLGVLAFYYFKHVQSGLFAYFSFAILGTLFFDLVTGLSVGPLVFHQSFYSALIGQIPFTLWHLLGNVSFALVLSPAIDKILSQPPNKKSLVVSFINFNLNKIKHEA